MAYDNPDGIIAAAVILQCLVIVFMVLRLHVRLQRKNRVIVSDWLAFAAAIFGLGFTAMTIYGCAVEAIGVPTVVGHGSQTTRYIELAVHCVGVPALGLIKASVSFFYMHIFDTPSYRPIFLTWIFIIFAWTITFEVGVLLECGTHLFATFTPSLADDEEFCSAATGIRYGMVMTDIVTDAITLLLPVPMIMALHMPLSRKILILLTFMVGLMSVGASVARGYIYIAGEFGKYQNDLIFKTTSMAVWYLVEIQVGILAACGPTLRPLFSDMLSRTSFASLLGSLRGGFSKGSSSSGRGIVGSQEGSEKKSAASDTSSEYLKGRSESSVTGGSTQRYSSVLEKPTGEIFVEQIVDVERV